SVGTSTNLPAGERPGDAATVPAPPGAIDTPQFLGPNRDGVLVGARLARDWASTPPREVWRRSVGAAWSAFAVVGGRAYTQEQRGEDEWVSCYALKDGSLLWAQTNRARFFQWQGGEGPRATPTVDRGRVFAFGGTGILDCLDATTGVRLWTRSVLAEHDLPNLIWGVSASPLVFGDTVVVTGGMTNRATALAYKRETGEPLWTAGTNMASYASPVYAKVAGRPLVLSVEASGLIGYDPATGAEVLRHVWGKGDWPKASQPVVVGEDRIFLSAGYTVGCLMIRVTARPDGGMSTEELWKNKRMKTQFNSAVYRGGDLFGLDDGLLACVDAETGERRWKDGRYGAGQILVVDDLIVIQSEPGFVALAEANRAGFRELGRIAALDAKTWNYPTLAGRYLIARTDREAVCYELPVEPGAVSGR
ncbi:MAG: PQQ-binding-like beta-propeller repeat protein, partial [Verrucomicrobiales bacterium]|nr:PQQ-binding-like beta-propeller repeat protein [Verrucomicrobiales bacterium]